MRSPSDDLFHRVAEHVDRRQPVLVTGVDGYVAGVLVRNLLSVGFTVHGTHRAGTDVSHLIQEAEQLEVSTDIDTCGSLKLYLADLLVAGSFDEAMKGCSTVFHMASPFLLRDGLDPQQDLIQPAVEGTKNVINSVSKSNAHGATGVRRVVLTSSMGAMFSDAVDSSDPNYPLNEDCWNRNSTVTHQPYFLSKTLAEQAAWVEAGSQKNWTLVVINSALILGPGVKCHSSSQSFQTLHKIGSGHWGMWFGCPHICMPIVDVRDVAVAHIVAAFGHSKDEPLPSGRFILAANQGHFTDIAKSARKFYPSFPIPRFSAFIVPKWAAWLVTPYLRQGVDRMTLWGNLNVNMYIDNSKSRRILQIKYRPIDETVRDMYEQLIDSGMVKPGPPPEVYGASILTAVLAVGVGLLSSYQDKVSQAIDAILRFIQGLQIPFSIE